MNPTVMNILENNDLCVLCTCCHDIPDASLMLYSCDEKCERMYMLTLKESTKYGNIAANPHGLPARRQILPGGNRRFAGPPMPAWMHYLPC